MKHSALKDELIYEFQTTSPIVPHLLTKSDFKLAQTCPTKLFYKKLGYPSTKEDNELLKMLARGGFIVEEIARQLHPGGIDIDYLHGHATAAGQTAQLLKKDTVTLYEATFISNGKLVRTDILNKKGNRLELIEVKAKSYNKEENQERIDNDKPNNFRDKRNAERILVGWKKYLEDITFQALTVQELYPSADIVPYLILLDKNAAAGTDVLYQNFHVKESLHPDSGRSSFDVQFTGDVQVVKNESLLIQVPVREEVELLLDAVSVKSIAYIQSLSPKLTKLVTPISKSCAGCEYRVEDSHSGFDECWASLGKPMFHVLDLVQAAKSGSVRDLIDSGSANMLDLTESQLQNEGAYAPRRIIQLEHTRAGTEWFSEDLGRLIDNLPYPLYFIDFETGAPAVPYFSGMKAYDAFPFQWSCHTVEAPGVEPVHSEWLNHEDEYPGFEFAKTLQNCIGSVGTVFRWGSHERTLLKRVRTQMKLRKYSDPTLELWLEDLIGDHSRMVDMEKICSAHYFHPLMKGRTSIKKVSDAIWQTNPKVRAQFPEYQKEEAPVSPYTSLASMTVDGEEVQVNEGVGAMVAYNKMLYGSPTEQTRNAYRDLLLQYCKLDTAAMVMIWRHWSQLVATS